jgi:hypothetical protein
MEKRRNVSCVIVEAGNSGRGVIQRCSVLSAVFLQRSNVDLLSRQRIYIVVLVFMSALGTLIHSVSFANASGLHWYK